MKKTIVISLLFAMLFATGCFNNKKPEVVTPTPEDTSKETTMVETEAETVPESTMYEDITELQNVDSVISLEREKVHLDEYGMGFKMVFKNGEEDICVYFTVPRNYKNKPFPTIVHFPETAFNSDYGNTYFTRYGYISVVISPRGADSTGSRDLGEKELSDIAFVMDILRNCKFVNKNKIYFTGAGTGSLVTYKAAKLYENEICGVATINTFADASAIHAQGGNSAAVCEYYFGGTPADIPEVYQQNSPIAFAADLKCPVLLLAYSQHPTFTYNMAESFKNAMASAGGDCSLVSLEGLNSDFSDKYAQFALQTFIEGEDSTKE